MTFLNVGTDSAIFDYASLVSEVEDHLQRDDLTAKMPRFVQMVENHLRRRLRTLDMETTVSLAASAGTVSLPNDFLSMRSLKILGDQATLKPDYPLRAMSLAALPQEFTGLEGRLPVAYAISGDSLLLTPPPEEEITLSMTYLARFTPLNETSVSNWIVIDHADVYFFGVLAHAYAYIEDPANAQAYADLFDGTAENIAMSRAKDRWGSGPLVPNTVAQVRGARC